MERFRVQGALDRAVAVGIITKTNIADIKGADQKLIVARDIMVRDIITVESNTSIEEANRIMIENGIGCLPVIEMGDLVGILTRSDLHRIIVSKEPDE